ncbi:MAG: SDR family NAD(P)-dependent oxidoreductase [Phycisphaerales bacterium]|nr:SDR family NAD(P)-dependent oxidoreductase [Phycisphaerales bacterium]
MTNLQGKRIWITGSSLGIGRSLAHELGTRGASVVLTARNEETLNTVGREVENLGGKVSIKPGDVTDLERMKSIISEVESEWGGIDILIANAGTHIPSDPVQFDVDEYLNLMNINYGGMLRCMEAVIPGMLERRSGRIVGVASLAGLRGMPTAAAYSASKGAMINFLQSSRFHLQDHNIGITIVNPGFVRTPLTDKNDFHMPFLIEPEKAAQIICNAIARERSEVSFPFPFSWTIRLLRIIPHPIYNWIMTRVWRRMKNN